MVKTTFYCVLCFLASLLTAAAPAIGDSQDWSVALFAFSEEPEGQRIWMVNGHDVNRYQPPEPTAVLAWSPDGNLLAYSPLSDPGRLKVKAGAGSGRTLLDKKVGARGDLWWSPQADRLAFLDDATFIPDPGSSEKPGSAWAGGLSIIEIKGGRTRRLVHNPQPPGDPISLAQWSPDGKWLAALDEGGGLIVVKADGADTRFCETLATGFTWQMDSKGLVLTGASHLGWRGIGVWRINLDRFEVILPPDETMSSEEFSDPSLSPGGDKLVFTYEASKGQPEQRLPVSIRCLDMATNKVTIIAGGQEPCWAPRFLPDGRVAFLSTSDSTDAYLIAEKLEAAQIDGSARETLAKIPGELFYSLAVVP